MRDTLFRATSLRPHFFYALIREKNKGSKWKGGTAKMKKALKVIGLGSIILAAGYFIAPDPIIGHIDDIIGLVSAAVINVVTGTIQAKLHAKMQDKDNDTEQA